MKPYELELTPLSSDRFTYLNKIGLLVADVSDLGAGFRIERLFNDACDEGIAIRSIRTGKVVRFVLSKIERRDGEVVAYKFTPFDKVDRPVNVTIFND